MRNENWVQSIDCDNSFCNYKTIIPNSTVSDVLILNASVRSFNLQSAVSRSTVMCLVLSVFCKSNKRVGRFLHQTFYRKIILKCFSLYFNSSKLFFCIKSHFRDRSGDCLLHVLEPAMHRNYTTTSFLCFLSTCKRTAVRVQHCKIQGRMRNTYVRVGCVSTLRQLK